MFRNRFSLILPCLHKTTTTTPSLSMPKRKRSFSSSESNNFNPQQLTLRTWNLRTCGIFDGEDAWMLRRQKVVSILKRSPASVVALQEVKDVQQMRWFLEKELSSRFSFVGVPRGERDEACPLAYDENRVRLLDEGTIWLSETPLIPSKSWDAACPRVATWGCFETVKSLTPFRFCAVSTHLDHVSDLAREMGSSVLRDLGIALQHKFDAPIVLMGDFNSLKNTKAYSILTSNNKKKKEDDRNDSFLFRDAWTDSFPNQENQDAWSTMHKFQGTRFTGNEGDGTVLLRENDNNNNNVKLTDYHIDWVLYTPNKGLVPIAAKVDTENMGGGIGKVADPNARWPSDHFPLEVVFDIK